MREAIGPLDRENTIPHAQLLQSQISGRRPFEAIQIGVIQRQTSATVFVDQREGRAADVPRIDAEPLREAAHERRLAGPEIA